MKERVKDFIPDSSMDLNQFLEAYNYLHPEYARVRWEWMQGKADWKLVVNTWAKHYERPVGNPSEVRPITAEAIELWKLKPTEK